MSFTKKGVVDEAPSKSQMCGRESGSKKSSNADFKKRENN